MSDVNLPIRYKACTSDDTDIVAQINECNYCVYEGETLGHGATRDIGNDGYIEVCQVASPGVWFPSSADIGECSGNATFGSTPSTYQQCSEAGSNYQTDNNLHYVGSSENYGYWCVYDTNTSQFNWLTGQFGGIAIDDIQHIDGVEEICGDGFDSMCIMHDKFVSTDGVVDFTQYIADSGTFAVPNLEHNIDRFNPYCHGGLNVTVEHFNDGVLVDANVTVRFAVDDAPVFTSGLTAAVADEDAHVYFPLPASQFYVTASHFEHPECDETRETFVDYTDITQLTISLCAPPTSPIQAAVSCPSGQTLVITTRQVILEGELVSMHIATCQ